MSECTPEYASLNLPAALEEIPVTHLSWHDIQQIATTKSGTNAEKRLLAELRTYLERIMKIQNQESNLVFNVVLSEAKPSWSALTWLQMVVDHRRYFHPVGDGWPKQPPNYIAFRYRGQLQHIHHIDSWKIVTDINQHMPELRPGAWDKPHFLYTLGPAIVPSKVVKTGKLYANGRYWAMLDLLLTCDTIAEARDKTKVRFNGEAAPEGESDKEVESVDE